MPQATKKVFLYDGAENDGQSSMYVTGDRAVHGLTGDLICLGRDDEQVKINGQRVETGAVENAVLSCAGVTGCTVIVVDTSGGLKSIVAFAVVKQGAAAVTEAHIKAHVTQRVARHEVPHRILIIERIPLTVAGKADRKALIALLESDQREAHTLAHISHGGLAEALRHALGRQFDAQTFHTLFEKLEQIRYLKVDESVSDDRHRRMREIFQKLLGHAVGNTESFFDEGGTSIMLMQLRNEVASAFGVSLPFADLLKSPTVNSLCELIGIPEEAPSSRIVFPSVLMSPKISPVISLPSRHEESVIVVNAPLVQSWMGRRHFLRGSLQFVLSLVLVIVYMCTILPGLIFLLHVIPSDYFYLYPLAVPVSWTTILVLHIALKWLLIGRYKQGKHLLWSAFFFRWWFVNRLRVLAYGSTSFFVTRDSLVAKLWLLALGARISWRVRLRHSLADFDLIRMGPHSGIESALRGSVLRASHLRLAPIGWRRVRGSVSGVTCGQAQCCLRVVCWRIRAI